jgi:hypothetical protein
MERSSVVFMPFTVDQFMDVFKLYNLSVWPTQIILNILALVAIFIALKKFRFGNRINTSILGFLWLWIGVVYHLIHFTSINNAAYIFGVLFILQGFIFIYAGIVKDHLSFNYQTNIYGITGAVFLLYALILYPVLGHLFGHIYPKSPTFGLPCPTTIFTFGLLLWTDKKIPKYVLVIPFLWSIVGFSAAVNLKVYEDFGLLVAGIIGTVLILLSERKTKKIEQG